MATKRPKRSYDEPLLSTDTQFELISESRKNSHNILDATPDMDNNLNPKNNNDLLSRRQPQFVNHSQKSSKYTINDETETEIMTDQETVSQDRNQRRSQRSSTSAMYSEYRPGDDSRGHFEIDEQNLRNNGIVIGAYNNNNNNNNYNNKNSNDRLDRISQTPSQYKKQLSTSHHTHSNSIYTDTGQIDPDHDNDTLGMFIMYISIHTQFRIEYMAIYIIYI